MEPRRVSWPTLQIMVIGTLIGGWALIGVLLSISKSFDTVIGASWLWVIMAFLLAQLAYVASAVESIGSVPGPLPFGGRVLGAEVAEYVQRAGRRDRGGLCHSPGLASPKSRATTRRRR